MTFHLAVTALLLAAGSASAQVDQANQANQANQDALVKRALMERQQQTEENVLRLRQALSLSDARSKGASAAQLHELEIDQLNQRAQQQSLNDQQRLRLQSLPQSVEGVDPARATYELLRAERERREQRSGFETRRPIGSQGFQTERPSWSPSLESRQAQEALRR